MATTHISTQEIPGSVFFTEGNNDLPKVVIKTAWSTAELYLHGAQVTHFQKTGEPPVLWMSQLSRFEAGTPIRGGIPVIFPWFGPREDMPSHGFARTQTWDLREISQLPGGAVSLRLGLPDSAQAALLPSFKADLWITVGKTLAVELVVTNSSTTDEFPFECCFHTYFHLGGIDATSISGLQGAEYIDQCDKFARKIDHADQIRIAQETDRIYLNTTGPVEIRDSRLGRRIRVDKTGSFSTVVWNPWIAKAQQMPDFGSDEYLEMVCVESGNVNDNSITLPAGKSACLKIELSTLPL